MKKKWIYISLIAALALVVSISLWGTDEEETAPFREMATLQSPDPDTLTTSSSTDEVTFNFGAFRSSRDYAFQVSADSLSGATDATCYLEINLDRTSSDWATLETVTVNGVSTREYETGTIESAP